jgi:hypothetical protein
MTRRRECTRSSSGSSTLSRTRTSGGRPTQEAVAARAPQGLSIELHAPTSSTQKLKLMRKGGKVTYTPTPPSRADSPRPHTWNIGVGYNYFN